MAVKQLKNLVLGSVRVSDVATAKVASGCGSVLAPATFPVDTGSDNGPRQEPPAVRAGRPVVIRGIRSRSVSCRAVLADRHALPAMRWYPAARRSASSRPTARRMDQR